MTVRFYFDFVSPYSYLALVQARDLADRHGIDWDVRPVVYGALLDSTGLIGPAEIEIKRRYTFADIQRCAALLGVPLVGPPAHPFRSLEALRTVCLFRDHPKAVDLAVSLAGACWGQGRALTDASVIVAVLDGLGLPSVDLAARLGAPETKEALRKLTADALARGVFGVPTFELAGELFWGHDRIDHLVARIEGRIGDAAANAEALLARPRGADRPTIGEAHSDRGTR